MYEPERFLSLTTARSCVTFMSCRCCGRKIYLQNVGWISSMLIPVQYSGNWKSQKKIPNNRQNKQQISARAVCKLTFDHNDLHEPKIHSTFLVNLLHAIGNVSRLSGILQGCCIQMHGHHQCIIAIPINLICIDFEHLIFNQILYDSKWQCILLKSI